MSCCSSQYPSLADLIKTSVVRSTDTGDPDNYGNSAETITEEEISVDFQPVRNAAGRTDSFAGEREKVDAVMFTDTLTDIMATKATAMQQAPDKIRFKNVLYYALQVEDWRDTLQPHQKVFLMRVDNQ